jgi:hypothetical protein
MKAQLAMRARRDQVPTVLTIGGRDFVWDRLTGRLLPAISGGASGDLSLIYQTEQTMTVTNLHSLASSVTAGWQSAVVDASGGVYEDYHLQVVLDFANTAPANSKAAFVYLYSGLSNVYTNPATGSEGTITLPDITVNSLSLVQARILPYVTQDEVVESGVISVAAALGVLYGICPSWGVVIMNHSGAALAGSGNTVKYRGVRRNVAP